MNPKADNLFAGEYPLPTKEDIGNAIGKYEDNTMGTLAVEVYHQIL